METYNFEILKIEYGIEMLELDGHVVAEITALVTAKAEKRQMLTTALSVDGHTLLPSGKIILSVGETTSGLRPIRIIDPLTINTPFSKGGYIMYMTFTGIDNKTISHKSLLDIPVTEKVKS